MNEKTIFKKGSTTFYTSSLFFPKEVKKDVFDLYSFVRVADDYVDTIPAQKEQFYHLRRLWEEQIDPADGESIDDQVVRNIRRVSAKYHFRSAWVVAFLDAMQSDLVSKRYKTIDDTLKYVYGSAEVIGLMMARIMGLPKEADQAAQLQGRAMQIINFIRDIDEDNKLGRRYFPVEDLKQFKLKDLSKETAQANPQVFNDFIHFQLDRYALWQSEAYSGYSYVPKRLRIPLKTASDMYNWTAEQIRQNPQIVFERKVKPSKVRVLSTILKNILK